MRSIGMALALLVTIVLLQAAGLATQARADYKPFIRSTECYGAFTKNKTSSGYTMNYDIVVRDFDGIPSDGGVYTVTVQNPSGSTQALVFDELESWHTGYWSGGGDPIADGNYTFTVTDPDGHSFTVVDTVTSSQVPIINPVTITGNGTTPTISWSAVTGATHYQVRIYDTSNNSVWKQRVNQTQHIVPPGVLNASTDYYVRVRAFIAHRGFMFQEMDDFSESADYPFTTGAVSESPYFALDLNRGLCGWSDPYKGPHMSFWVRVFDAQGIDSVRKVYAIAPDGTTIIPLYLESENSTEAVFHRDYAGLATGTYSFVAEDADGHVTTQTATYNGDTVSVVDNDSLSPAHNTVVGGDTYNFTWDRVTDATYYEIEFLDQNGNTTTTLAVADTGANPSIPIPVSAFYEGILLKWRVKAYSDWMENGPEGHSGSEWTTLANNIRSSYGGGSLGGPTLDLNGLGVHLVHAPNWNQSGTEYALWAVVKVTDPDSIPGNIKYVKMTYPGGGTQVDLYFAWSESATTGYYMSRQTFPDAASVPSGTYCFTVEDTDGTSDSLCDDLTPVDLGVPQNCRPVDAAHVSDRPQFQCDEVTGATKYMFRAYENYNTVKVQSPYLDTFSGRPDTGELDKNALYRYRAYAFSGDPETDWDNLSANMYYPTLEPYFLTDKPADAGAWKLLLLGN